MTQKSNAKQQLTIRHPFFIVLGIIVIFYGGYLFGQWLKA